MFDVSRTTGRWPSILLSLGVSEKTLSKNNCPCPFCEGKDRFRFTDKDGAGIWICNQCGTGNGFHFVQKWEGTNFRGACAAIERVLPQTTLAKVTPQKDSRAKLNALWATSQPVDDGDHTWEYLTSRQLLLPKGMPEIRTALQLAYWEDGQIKGRYPAMVARVRDGKGKPTTLHVTYLEVTAGLTSKAKVASAKKVMSAMGDGAHIRLSSEYDNRLCLTEGIETGLAVQEMSGTPTWALISAGNMDKFVCPEGVDYVSIWCDNDLNFVGQKHAFALANRMSMQGVTVEVMIPPVAGLDWADVLYSRKEVA